MSPVDDTFMSSSMDHTVRLWDLRAPTCRGLLNLPAPSIVAYDSSGVVFAIAVNHYSRILLYDHANFDKAPFLTITLEDPTLSLVSYPPRAIYITSMAFSSNGKYLLIGCSGDAHYVMDAFEGHLLAKLEGHVGLERRRLDAPQGIEPQRGCSGEEVSWTPDSNYVLGGSLDGRVCVWDLQNLQTKTGAIDLKAPPLRLQPIAKMDGHPSPSRCLKFNPRLAMMCTAGAELVRQVLCPNRGGSNIQFVRRFGYQTSLRMWTRWQRNCLKSLLPDVWFSFFVTAVMLSSFVSTGFLCLYAEDIANIARGAEFEIA